MPNDTARACVSVTSARAGLRSHSSARLALAWEGAKPKRAAISSIDM